MLKTYKYRIYPTIEQKILLEKHFNCVRYIYNWGLEQKIKYYQKQKRGLSLFTLISNSVKLKKEKIWLKEVNAQSLQMSLRNLDNAFTKFFKKNAEFPKFKSKKTTKASAQFSQYTKVNFNANLLHIIKIPNIKCIFHRQFMGKIKTTTILKTKTNKYFACILVDTGEPIPAKPPIVENTTIGIDLGLKNFCITSNGEKITNPKYFKKQEKRLKHHQRMFSKKQKGSKNREKQRLKVTKIYEKITNQKQDFLHKLSAKLIRENQTICLEDLNITGMLQNHCLAKAISNVSWYEFKRQLIYKAEWYGRNILFIGRFDPSSKICSKCGTINKKLTLADRIWTCINCNTIHDRDINAAINIKDFSLLHRGDSRQSLNKASQRNLGNKTKTDEEKKFVKSLGRTSRISYQCL